MKLQVALTNPHPAWQLILDQEKISYTILSDKGTNGSDDEPVFIYTSRSVTSKQYLEKCLKNQGAVVLDRSFRHDLDRKQYQDQIFEVPVNLSAILFDSAYQEKKVSFGKHEILETMASNSKSVARQEVVSTIKKAFFSKGLPYVHLWYYPKGYRSLFSFRFDLDEYDPNDHQVLLELLEESRGSVSCFACMKTYENYKEQIDQVVKTGVEVGSHGYVHHVYHNYEQNNWNLKKAALLLKRSTDQVVGFSGPHGKWDPTLQRVLEQQKYQYSSEFSLDYDNFPFYVHRDGAFSNVLQIPTHPICEGVFLQSYDFNLKMFEEYYETVIEEKLAAYEPILIFGHPTRRLGRYPEIFRSLQNRIRRKSHVWHAEFRTICNWWNHRHQEKFEAVYKEGKIYLEKPFSDDFELRYVYPDKKMGWASVGDLLKGLGSDLRSVEEMAPLERKGPREINVERGALKKLKRALKLWMDWETKTPRSELKVVDFPTFVKKMIRVFKK